MVLVAKQFIPNVNMSNFNVLFKLSSEQVANHLKIPSSPTSDKQDRQMMKYIRNFLIFLFWVRRYLTFGCIGVFFRLDQSSVMRIVRREVAKLALRIGEVVNTNSLTPLDNFFLKRCVGVVDSSEFRIYTWVGDSYSGKKKFFSLKYQVVICLDTQMPVQIDGPHYGKVSDAKIWKESGMPEFLKRNHMYVLGDKGYQGCERVKHCLKKKRGEKVLAKEKKEYNRKISTKRILVENHFADLKVFQVLTNSFRGVNVNFHSDLFLACEYVLYLSKT